MNTKAKTAAKPRRGRPSKYRPEYAEQARKLCLLGLTDSELGDFFGVDEATIHRWKHANTDFCESILTGKMRADSEVADSLYKSAVGGHFITEERPPGGESGPASVPPFKRQVAPSVQAQSLWLRNRQPRLWRDRVEVKADVNIDPFPPKEKLQALLEDSLRRSTEMAKALIGRRERLGIVVEPLNSAD